MACISYKNKCFRFQDPRGAVFYAKRGRMAAESKVLPSDVAVLPGCCSVRHGGGFHQPSSDSESGRCIHPILQRIMSGRGWRQSPAAQSSTPCQSPRRSMAGVAQGTSGSWGKFEVLGVNKRPLTGLMLPAPSMSFVPMKLALLRQTVTAPTLTGAEPLQPAQRSCSPKAL